MELFEDANDKIWGHLVGKESEGQSTNSWCRVTWRLRRSAAGYSIGSSSRAAESRGHVFVRAFSLLSHAACVVLLVFSLREVCTQLA